MWMILNVLMISGQIYLRTLNRVNCKLAKPFIIDIDMISTVVSLLVRTYVEEFGAQTFRHDGVVSVHQPASKLVHCRENPQLSILVKYILNRSVHTHIVVHWLLWCIHCGCGERQSRGQWSSPFFPPNKYPVRRPFLPATATPGTPLDTGFQATYGW